MCHTVAFVSKQKETNNKGNGPICRKDVWSPLLNAFNQVRRPSSTFYASIDYGHALMKHTIITESRKMKIGTVHSFTSNGPSFSIVNVKITQLEMLQLNMILEGLFFLSQSLVEVTPAIVGKVKTDVVSCNPTRWYLSFILGPLYW